MSNNLLSLVNDWVSWLVALILALLGFGTLTGCQGMKATDTTKAIEAVTAGERQVTYTVVPGSLAGMPQNTIAIPTVPGKDVQFHKYFPDGTPEMTLTTRRSDVIDILFASAAGIDAEKFAEDARTRAWISSEREAWMGLAQPFLAAALQRYQSGGQPAPPSNGTGDLKTLLRTELQSMVPDLATKLRAELGLPPKTN